jgi:hypothetical protein
MLAEIALGANVVSGAAAFIAAALWFWASRTPIPAFPDVGFDSGSWVFDPIRNALATASNRNAWAAFFSGAAALAFGVALAGERAAALALGP